MPRVIFVCDYIYTPTLVRQVSTKFKASAKRVLVNADCASKAIAAGAAQMADLQLDQDGDGWPGGKPPAAKRPAAKRSGGAAAPRARRARVQNPA